MTGQGRTVCKRTVIKLGRRGVSDTENIASCTAVDSKLGLRIWPDWGLNPGFLNIYQVLYQLSYLARGNQWDGLSFVTLNS